MNKRDVDWMRSSHNLRPRPMDWQEKVTIIGCAAACVICLLLLAAGVIT